MRKQPRREATKSMSLTQIPAGTWCKVKMAAGMRGITLREFVLGTLLSAAQDTLNGGGFGEGNYAEVDSPGKAGHDKQPPPDRGPGATSVPGEGTPATLPATSPMEELFGGEVPDSS